MSAGLSAIGLRLAKLLPLLSSDQLGEVTMQEWELRYGTGS
ncbi:hypothetical protein [Belnapia rosea]|nr:hypothetical protein [Belnapia rosea]SDB74822.1 hypothetical protein SAMN02927895_05524 [Belnapia rosea]